MKKENGLEQDTIKKNYSIFSFSPEVSQFLKLVDNQEVSCFVEPLDLISKEVIILAVNNASDPSQPGGSHWSLLVYTSQVIHIRNTDWGGVTRDAKLGGAGGACPPNNFAIFEIFAIFTKLAPPNNCEIGGQSPPNEI